MTSARPAPSGASESALFALGEFARAGLLNAWLIQALGLASPPFNAYSLGGMIGVESLLWAPVVDQWGRLNFPTRHPLNHSDNARVLVAQADVILGLELTDFRGCPSRGRFRIEHRLYNSREKSFLGVVREHKPIDQHLDNGQSRAHARSALSFLASAGRADARKSL